jgi:PKHD-type hydroxylase|tara:strand:- start:1429 stop:2013 length:585 start_codon:yes stop_codon:yes gene_type:complete
MSYYSLLPHPTFDEVDYGTWEEGFTLEECDRIIELGESVGTKNSLLGQGLDTNIRKSQNSWLQLNNNTEWIYERLGNISRCLNGMHWRYDITGFNEDLQYTKYSDDKSFYGWHIDSGSLKSENPPRKLSLTLQLSEPSEYDGGDFQIHASKLNTVSKKKGLICVFPSYSLHQVTPITRGVRRSLVVWLCGPAFR